MKLKNLVLVYCLLAGLVAEAFAGPLPTGLALTNLLEGPAAGSDSVVLSATTGWTASANASWLHVNSGTQAGTVSTNVIFSFDANAGATRSGMLTIAGKTLTVTQAGSVYVAADTGVLVPLVSSGLTSPAGVAVDGAGNVYIADTGDGALKEWIAASNTVVTLVSGLNEPEGVALDGAGHVFIADSGDNAIKEWTISSKTLSTLSNPVVSFPVAIAVDGAGNIFWDDQGSDTSTYVYEWPSTTVAIMPGLTTGVAVDGAGNFYYSDWWNNQVVERNQITQQQTVLVSGIYNFYPINGPTVTVDGSGNLYVVNDFANSALFIRNAASQTTRLVLSGADIYGAAVDPAENVYFVGLGGEITELPHVLVDPTPRIESPLAGSDVLPVVLPISFNLTINGPFKPTTDQSWLTVTSIASGVVHYAFTANSGTTNRTAHITLLGRSILVTQTNFTYTYALGATNRQESAAAGSDSVNLTVLPAGGGPWTASVNVPWMHLDPANQSGTGSATVTFTLDVNPGAPRTGTLTIGGQALNVTQGSFSYTLGATNLSESPVAGSDSVSLAVSPGGATWTATTNVPWLHLSPANQSGAGSATVTFSFDANPGATRTGTLTIAGQTLTVTQTSFIYALATNSLSEGTAADSDSVALTVSPAGGAWTATANVSWLHLSPASQSGTGSATVTFGFDADSGITRVGTLTIAGQTLTITQAGPRSGSPHGALAFNGSGQNVVVSGFGEIAPTNEVTIEFWAYINQAGSQAAFMLSPIDPTDRWDGHIDFSDGTTYWDCGDTTGSGRLTMPNPPGSITNWMHYAFVADQHGNAMYLYTNGVLAACKVGMTPFVRGNYELGIGGDNYYFLNGQLDEFRVWNVARSQAQILADMGAPLVGNEPGLLLYYKFDETSGNIASNSASATGSAYNGTLLNGPTRVAGTPFTTFTPTYWVTTTADAGAGSLRLAIVDAAIYSGPDIIGFAPGLDGGTIQLNSQISFHDTDGVTIDATTLPDGLTIQGLADQGAAGNFGLFSNPSGCTVNFRGLTFAKGGGGGFTDYTDLGGAINNAGTLTLIRCCFSNNVASQGGAIYNTETATLAQCTLSGNSANNYHTDTGGGAICNDGGTVTLTQCTLSGNYSSAKGGAIVNSFGTDVLTQCTLSGNRSTSKAGAISQVSGTDTITQCTLSDNFGAEGAGAIDANNSLLILDNNIIARNNGGEAGNDIIKYESTVTRVGANIIQDLLDYDETANSGPAAINADPHLAPLGNYGGLTQTMPPLPGSPVIDAGAPTSLTTDQRGFAMPQDNTGTGIARPEIGAVEGVYNPAGPGMLTGLGPYTSWAPVGQQRLEFTQFTNGSTAYTVLATTNLGVPFNAWSNLGTNVVEAPAGSGEFLFTDVNATNVPARFYRVKSF